MQCNVARGGRDATGHTPERVGHGGFRHDDGPVLTNRTAPIDAGYTLDRVVAATLAEKRQACEAARHEEIRTRLRHGGLSCGDEP